MNKETIQKAKTHYLLKHNLSSWNLKGALFDMDGVLFDSMPAHAKSWSQAFRNVGVEFSERDVYLNEGRRGCDTVQKAFLRQFNRKSTPEEEVQIYKDKSRLFQSFPSPLLIPNALKVVQTLKEKNIARTIVSGTGEATTIRRVLNMFPGLFEREKMITAYDVVQGKPNAEPYLKGLEKLQLKNTETIVVENAPLGVRAGVAAKIFTIAVNTGPLKDADLLEAGANLVLKDMDEFLFFMDEIISPILLKKHSGPSV